MFHYNDKVTLTAANSINKDGKIVNFNLSFPIKDENLVVPEDIIQIYIYECTDNSFIGSISFKICVGKTTNLSTLVKSKEQFSFLDRNISIGINRIDDKLCYYDDNSGKHVIFAKINKGDIVVKDTEELKKLLIYISNEFLNIKTSVSKIKWFTDNDIYIKQNQEEVLKITRTTDNSN